MEELIMKNINCPSCNHHIEYWTKNTFMECIECKNMIEVEPCEDVVDIEIVEEEIIEEDESEAQ